MKPYQRWGFSLIAAAAAALSPAQAQTYSFTAFETSGVGDPGALAPIQLNATLSQNGTSLDVIISNDSQPGDGWVTSTVPTVTKMSFDDDAAILPAPTFANNPPNVAFHTNNSVNIPGSNNIGFDTTYGFSADPPPTTTGIDPGEQFVVTFANLTAAEFANAVENGDLRIATHVQQIGKGDWSASYVTQVPEPSSALLVGLGGVLALVRRRR